MASQSSLEDRIASGRYYMNKIFGRGLERARALDESRNENPLGPVRRVTIEPQSDGSHRVVVERAQVAQPETPLDSARDRAVPREHSFASAGDAIRFLDNVLNPPQADEPAEKGGGEAGRFLDEILDETAATRD